ncbi:hypothetical protein K2173_019887 [Erythroxylum novogranatense]|uniref:Uncharacterized protein n=1 Tax=Erythroxylum novogranatense TaxID=1862640 RepID=A0AAV8U6J9_9ROSI|nr:hypothetical protein K2173_019887 [Erythroxylum novogranatense]
MPLMNIHLRLESLNGARALMLDTYDFQGDVWLCHSLNGQCHNFTAFGRAIDFLKEIDAFMAAKPAEIVTLILEDYVHAPNGLTKVFTDAGLMKYWFPLANMPKNGGDWPLVSDMVKNNQRLLVFTSIESKEESEGIAYQWNYMVENQYGHGGMLARHCPNRAESTAMNDKTKSLVLVNYFPSVLGKLYSSVDNANDLIKMLHIHAMGGTFQAVDTPNGKLLCGCDDVRACMLNKIEGFLLISFSVTTL